MTKYITMDPAFRKQHLTAKAELEAAKIALAHYCAAGAVEKSMVETLKADVVSATGQMDDWWAQAHILARDNTGLETPKILVYVHDGVLAVQLPDPPATEA